MLAAGQRHLLRPPLAWHPRCIVQYLPFLSLVMPCQASVTKDKSTQKASARYCYRKQHDCSRKLSEGNIQISQRSTKLRSKRGPRRWQRRQVQSFLALQSLRQLLSQPTNPTTLFSHGCVKVRKEYLLLAQPSQHL